MLNHHFSQKKKMLNVTADYFVSHQLTELHDQEEGDALTALAQTLKDVGMFKAPVGIDR